MVMCKTDNEIRHRIINSQFSNRFTNSSTVLKIKCAGFHSFNITLFTKSQKHFFIGNNINVFKLTTIGVLQQ
uniref:Uncharacterized protein n=1 Tax=Rhizophora mucronata TaxID=61149 RepID=A0A2P2K824_RHIMU